jgi:hypothetical protein
MQLFLKAANVLKLMLTGLKDSDSPIAIVKQIQKIVVPTRAGFQKPLGFSFFCRFLHKIPLALKRH